MAPRIRRLIYLDGPLFSEAERRFNHRLISTLKEARFRMFSPQGDGVQSSKSPNEQMSPEARCRVMFDPDKAKIFALADMLVFVLDGRVPAEGACVQLGIAHSQSAFEHPKKLLV